LEKLCVCNHKGNILWEECFVKILNCICLTLVIVGAINWGLVGIFDFNLVSGIFGDGTIWTRIVYALVGLAGLYSIGFYGNLGRDDA